MVRRMPESTALTFSSPVGAFYPATLLPALLAASAIRQADRAAVPSGVRMIQPALGSTLRTRFDAKPQIGAKPQ
jgi:hypothetical protein